MAKFAAAGKNRPKKDLRRIAMTYGNVYVAQIAMGANDSQVIKAFLEAEEFDGPSLIIAYSHCIFHGIDIRFGMNHQKMAVDSGYWPLYRYNPSLEIEGKDPLRAGFQRADDSVERLPLRREQISYAPAKRSCTGEGNAACS